MSTTSKSRPAAVEGLGDAWDMAELGDDQPGQRVEVAFGEAGRAPKRSRNSSRAMRPSRSHDPSGRLTACGLLRSLGLHRHVADDGLEDVAQGQQALDGPEFVENHGDAAGRFLECLQSFQPASSFVDEERQGETPLDPEGFEACVLRPGGL